MTWVDKFLLALLLGLMPIAASAAISVDSLNYPAWVERGTDTLPLAPGDRLQTGDLVHTGALGRVWLKLEGGNMIKLGQDARFAIDDAEFREGEQGPVLEATFNVLKGAFRFTSGFFTIRRPGPHRLDFQVGAITASVQGKDILGRAGEGEDFIALLEGRIEVASADQDPVVLDRALTRYRKAKREPADPVNSMDRSMVEGLAAETELDRSVGVASTFGPYSLVLQSFTDPTNVDGALQRFLDAGYAVRTHPQEVDGTTYTRIQLEGLIHLKSANNLRQAMIAAGLVEDAWVSNPE